MRRKRRNRGNWFPVIQSFVGDDESLAVTYDAREYEVPFNPVPAGAAVIVIPDQTVDEGAASFDSYTLRDAVEGQAYILQRIVGKIAWSCAQFGGQEGDTWQQIICCTAFAILPVSNSSENQAVPEVPFSEYDPLNPSNADKPFIWRRTWVLGNNAAVESPSFQNRQYQAPANNAFFSSIQDGPHIDSKSKRRVGRGERLFMIHSVGPAYPQGGTVEYSAFASVVADLRVYGNLVKQKASAVFT